LNVGHANFEKGKVIMHNDDFSATLLNGSHYES